jgi:hypothetical protein
VIRWHSIPTTDFFVRRSGENLRNGWNLQKAAGSCLVSYHAFCNDENLIDIECSDERPQGTQVLPLTRIDQTKPNPKSGAVQLEWNNTGDLLLVRFGAIFPGSKSCEKLRCHHLENVPTAVHIFDFPSPQQEFVPRLRSVLLHSHPVLSARWNPVRKGSLLLGCGTRSVYVWSDEWMNEGGEEEEMAECIGVPTRKFLIVFLTFSFLGFPHLFLSL